MRKDSRQAMKAKMLTTKTTRRYRTEWEGEWKWAAMAMISMRRVKTPATGWTTRISESVLRVAGGRSNVAESAGEKSEAGQTR